MLRHTRRRALGLLIAVCAGTPLAARTHLAFAQDEDEEADARGNEDAAPEDEVPDCFASKKIGPWTAQATDLSAGAMQRDVPTATPKTCDLALEFQVNADFDARIYLEGSQDGTPLPENVLLMPESRLIAKDSAGTVVVDTPLCGNCTDIYEDTVAIVLPLATAPLLRDEDAMEIALRLAGKDEDCLFQIDCLTMRQALDWASEQREMLAEKRDNRECASAEGCFITTACCEVLGLDDDCFELRNLRRYRDEVLSKQPAGTDAIARYYKLAPKILEQLHATHPDPDQALISVYGRFVLPAAMAAGLGLNWLAYRIYVRMLNELAAR